MCPLKYLVIAVAAIAVGNRPVAEVPVKFADLAATVHPSASDSQ